MYNDVYIFFGKTLDEIKQIISLENEKERQAGLRSLSTSLLSEKNSKKTSSTLQAYLDGISIDFKVVFDTHFSELRSKETELLCLIKLRLSISEISKLLNINLPAIKLSRYRIHKKLGLDFK